jgi:membrane protein involved in colicin uptake
MQVTNIEVGYDRKRQPAQYESAGATVKFTASLSATVGDNEDHIAVATKLLGDAKTIVLVELGIVKAGESASATVKAAAETTAKAAGETAKTPTAAEKKAAKAAAEAAAKTGTGQAISTGGERTAPDDDIPGEGAPASSKGGETPADLPDDVPADKKTAATGQPAVSHEELHTFIAGEIRAKRLDHATVKAVSASKEFGVAKIAELKPEQVGPYLEALKAKIKELAGGNELDGL